MGLSKGSTGICAIDKEIDVTKNINDKIIALAGNPNVGKSTIFNQLTGMNQHTGNWPGKTVSNASGSLIYNGKKYIFMDLPGTYSITAKSVEEEIARDFICFKNPDAVAIVCDATCLERNLNLVLQILELTDNAVVCVNLMDEAKKKDIKIDLETLSENLGVSVVGMSARSNKGIKKMLEELEKIKTERSYKIFEYSSDAEKAIELLREKLTEIFGENANCRFIAVDILGGDTTIFNSVKDNLEIDLLNNEDFIISLNEAKSILPSEDTINSERVLKAEEIAKKSISTKRQVDLKDRKIDKVLIGKKTGIPIMLLMLGLILWITIVGANYPSKALSYLLFEIEDRIKDIFYYLNAPQFITGILVDGVYHVLAWIVAVMLPPMAIFFPLFTILEDLGYLPRVAFNLDHYFKKVCACGKQSLTMCMGFGCNAAGVVGARIIDSPRERLIAIITNSLVPCNGRFPTLITLITVFFVGTATMVSRSFLSAVFLLGVIILGVFMTFFASFILSKTVLKGLPSSFTLELPPYRKPQIAKVIVRSIFDRTLFVLGRAVVVAAPAGAIIWCMANISVGGATLLYHCTEFLDPFASLFGMDGTILMAFILGFPANEIVLPIIIMSYTSGGTLIDAENLFMVQELLVNNGWTVVTAICVMLFSLMHWPCSTTCITIYKETKSVKWTFLSAILPTLFGFICCFIVASVARVF